MKTQLTRSMTNKVFGGVAGGIADAFGWDPTLVRLGFVLLALGHGAGVLLYLILILVMPKAGERSLAQQTVTGVQSGAYHLPNSEGRNKTLGYVLLAVGGIMIVSSLHLPGPVIALIIVGAGYYLLRKR